MKKSIIALTFVGAVALSGCGDSPEVVAPTTTKTTTTTTTTTTKKTTTKKKPTTTTEAVEEQSGTGDGYAYDDSYNEGLYTESGLGEEAVAQEPIVETTDEAQAALEGAETSVIETTETTATSETTTTGTTTSGTSTTTSTTTTTTAPAP